MDCCRRLYYRTTNRWVIPAKVVILIYTVLMKEIENKLDATVAILGGGTAGLSAAHELAERGFKVKVYEKQAELVGGKSRSMPVLGSGVDGREDLPGEHGFRFFPRFYRHIVDTMARIPFGDNANGVAGNLVDTTRTLFAQREYPDIYNITKFPNSLNELRLAITSFSAEQMGITQKELDAYVAKLWQTFTSCDERIDNEYEKVSTWDFIEADKFSERYQEVFADQARVLVAASPKFMSTRTWARVNSQLIFGILTPGLSTDRLLNGPTNEAWLTPWREYLQELGVELNMGKSVDRIHFDVKKNAVTGVTLTSGEQVEADYYIFALPVEVIDRFLTDEIIHAAPSLKGIRNLSKDVAWMNGIQYYLNVDIDVVSGHTFYVGTPWALTSIEQHRFWDNFDFSKYGNGKVKGIFSIDISDWDTPGLLHKKPAKECNPEEIKEEVWHQLKVWLNDDKVEHLRDDMVENWFIDTDIHQDETITTHYQNSNDEPLLINKPNTWNLRPSVKTEISNMFLASDYVKTNTELASMEAANEAARRAVNNIIDDYITQHPSEHIDYCEIYKLERPAFLRPLIAYDAKRYKLGLPWKDPLLENRFLRLWNRFKPI